ncbi:ectopic P granules protein 5 homolog isoform X1 [Pimephales promelas]|uniref:ectopic P granules protein 5 homolog isoform X1 n=1 Tax=Pimephales promelas TaxID=90988 RepID=UPI001955A3C9|nr:ectopic P granules protein 5 homolog isoform X1 [Pimephales promelas]KAG1968633.1 ectopic P granules protein [Pimephales promelas]
MEAVRPKKSKSKSSGKPQVKKERQLESVRQSSGPSRELEPGPALFTDVPLSLSHVPPASDLNPPATQTSLDHNDKAEKDQVLLSDTTEMVNKLSCHEDKEHDSSSQDTTPWVDQVLTPTQYSQIDPKPLDAKLEPLSVPSIYPSIPASCPEPQLSEDSYSIAYGLLDTSFMPVASEGRVAPAVLPLANQESSPPSLVPVTVAEVEKPRERLYPELPRTCQSVKPFSSEQLRTWEPGSWLENVELHEAEFQSLAHQEGHELYELLLSYWRCRKQLTQAQTELQAANSDCKNVQNRMWSFKDERLSLQAICADQTKVFGYHCYQQVTLNEAALAEVKLLFSAKAEILHQTVALHSYTSILSRLQVESYLYRLLSSNPTTKSVAVQDTSTVSPKSQPSSLQSLKESISVLFIFTRRVLDDSQFQADIHLWLQRLVSVLHHVGSRGDHLFILNHLLCCPADVGKWAVPFLQIKVLDNPSGMYHFMQALAILMSPARHRADFLGHMKPSDVKGNNSFTGPQSGNWTLVDEGGEEDEDPETSWMLLSEDDLVSLFSQFPFDELFKRLLGICSKEDYQPQATTSQKMMKIFAFASSLVELLAIGLQTYNRARYRQFVKRIGFMIRMTLCYVSDHWAQYISLTGVSRTTMQEQSFSMEKLQVEFDHLFLRAVLHVLKAKRLGIWLFMSEMPYGTLSSCMLWKIFYIMQCAEMDGLEKLSCSLSAEDCIRGLKEPSHQEKFQLWLSEINSSDGICLLTTFAHMAQPRRTEVDPEFVRNIVLDIYEVSYVSIATREIYSKVGRELLAAVATAHPHIISVLLERLRETIDKVGMVSLYLFKELPLHLWMPAQAEVGLIRDWLLNFSLSAVENRLACIILEGLNWGFHPNGCLILPASLHSEVALLGIEAYQKYLTDKPYAGILSEGIKQVSYLANVVRSGQTLESSFNLWAWDLVLRLKLHANERSPQDAWCPLPSSSAPSVPEITDSPIMHPVFKAVKAGIPIGCFLAFDMTTIGHSLEKLCSDGMALLKTLVQSRHLKAVVHILENILPLVYHCQFYLLKNEQFLSCIQLFLQIDSGTQGVTQQVTQKVAQHLIGTSTCENIKLLNSVIQAHILESSRPGRVGAVAVLEFWLQVLTEQNLWHRDRAVLYLLDHLCRAAFLHQQEECLQKLLYQQHKSALGYHGDKGLLSSLMGWIVAGNVTPSFIEGNCLTGEVWFAWLVLNMEAMFEEDSQLQRFVEHELLSNSACTPDQALKKAQVRLKLQVVPSLQRLMIYRWAQQALATPADHPLLPLVWQKFLQLYLRQPGPEFGLEVKGCIGKRYFHSVAHLSLLKSLRQRLIEVSDFHHAASKALKVPSLKGESSDGLLTPGTPITQYMTSPELHTELVRLFNVFALWLDDENLQKQEIFLPSLPKQYDAHRLAKIMQRQQEVWMEHVDIERVQHELQEVLSLWSKVKSEPVLSQNTNSSNFIDFINPLAARERILTHLRKHVAPQGALLLMPMKAPVPDIPTESLSDEKISTTLIQEDLAKLQHQAKLATVRETQQVALDNELLEVLPQLYINREEQLSVQLECRGKGGQPCQGPAHVTVKYSTMHKLDPVQNQIQCLKSDIKQLQADGIKAPPQSLAEAAVHTENFITALVNAYKLNTSPGILKVGIAAFYQIVSFVCEDTQRHPPTRQFFTSCIEILGQVFIRDVQSECKHMLKTILLNRHLCNLLSPYFTPNASPAELVSLYEEVVNTLHIDSGDVIFMLLTKFDLTQWLSATQPLFSERSRLMAIIHQALCICGLEPEAEVLMPFNIFCKHWNELLLYQFPDHYSDFLRLLMQSSSEQLLSPDCWRSSLRVLGCSPNPKMKTNKPRSILLSPQQVDETIEWLSKFFLKLRLSNADFRSFGLLSKWGPYIEEVKVFFEDLITYVIYLELNNCSKEPVGSPRLVKAVENLHAKMAKLFKPWILVLETDNTSHPRCSPWLESDAAAATSLVSLYACLVETLHEKFKDRLMPGQRGALWLHLMHYCETCTSPKMPEYLLYTFHTEYSRLPWKDLHPDQTLMNQFFNVERGSPKSCFLFMGELLCEVNWMSVLNESLSPQLNPSAQTMVVSVLYLMVFLAKEDLSKPESSVVTLLDQSTSLPWHLVDFPSYQDVMRYVSTHYPASLVLSNDATSQQVITLLRTAAGFGQTAQVLHHKEMTLKCQAFLHLMVQFLISLDQNGHISLASLETEMEKLLEYIVIFNPPETDLQQRHMATCSLFAEMLNLLNEAGMSTAEGLGTKLHSWVEKRARGPLVLPLLTAACRCLASVRHMTRTTEACILSYFTDGGCADQYSGWGPILVSLQVPELTVEDFIQESLSLGSYLTLYVYILQRLNLEQTLLNEKKTLVLLNTWISQVFPSGPADEAKLFLWWHKFLELLQIQVDQEDTCTLDTLILTLMAFQNRLAQLSEERLSSGILGAIGLGRKSPLSSRFRVVARSMSAFLLVQVPSENQLRLHQGTDLQLSAKAQQALSALEAMLSNKQYSELHVSVNQACQFIKYPNHCLRDSNSLLTLLVNALYTDLHYLDIIR